MMKCIPKPEMYLITKYENTKIFIEICYERQKMLQRKIKYKYMFMHSMHSSSLHAIKS